MPRNPLQALCPYFAMFPEEFAREQVLRHSKRGSLVLDCFSGRGTAPLEALLLGRRAVALDINPVAFVISGAKVAPPSEEAVGEVLDALLVEYLDADRDRLAFEHRQLGRFFELCFSAATAAQLLFLRRALDWRGNSVHRFIAALVLGSLHGEMDKSSSYFSNQMPRTISTKPDYSIRFWESRGLTPPDRDVFHMLYQRCLYRLSGSVPRSHGTAVLGDVRAAPGLIADRGVSLVLTSPPYLDVTNFEEDQWLRRWFLGGPPYPTRGVVSRDDRHYGEESYWNFLLDAWTAIRPVCEDKFRLVCRIGARRLDPIQLADGVLQSLEAAFPRVRLIGGPAVSSIRRGQRQTFSTSARGCGFEVDFAFAVTN